MPSFNVVIQETDKEIQQIFQTAFKKKADRQLVKAMKGMDKVATNAFARRIRSTLVYKDMQGGELQGLLGVVNPDIRFQILFEAWQKNFKTEFIPYTLDIRGGRSIFGLFGIRFDYSDVLNSVAAIQVTQRGDALPWLEWLLLRGDTTILTDYVARFGDFSKFPQSRTGLGLTLFWPGMSWRIPPQFSGTEDNNFVTDSLNGVEKIIENTVKRRLEKIKDLK